MKLNFFIKLFGLEGFSKRFEGCTAKNGDVCNGEYKVEDNQLFFTYSDSKGMLYDSTEIPNRIINLGLPYYSINKYASR